MTDTQTERQEFERIASSLSLGWESQMPFERSKHGDYMLGDMQAAWELWQAARAELLTDMRRMAEVAHGAIEMAKATMVSAQQDVIGTQAAMNIFEREPFVKQVRETLREYERKYPREGV